MKKHLCILILTAASGVFLFAADFWEGKPFTTWDEKECTAILTKSPWTFSNSFGDVTNIGMIETGGHGEREINVTFRFRFLSAKPVRAAFTRLRVLKNPTSAPPEDKIRQLVESPPDADNHVALQIEFSVDPPSSREMQRIHSFLLNAGLANFRDARLETSNKVLVAPLSYLPPNTQRANASLIFPRKNEKGEILFTGEEKWISFKTDILGYKVYSRLKPEKMKFEGQFEF